MAHSTAHTYVECNGTCVVCTESACSAVECSGDACCFVCMQLVTACFIRGSPSPPSCRTTLITSLSTSVTSLSLQPGRRSLLLPMLTTSRPRWSLRAPTDPPHQTQTRFSKKEEACRACVSYRETLWADSLYYCHWYTYICTGVNTYVHTYIPVIKALILPHVSVLLSLPLPSPSPPPTLPRSMCVHVLMSLNHSPCVTAALSTPTSTESIQKSLEAKFFGGEQGQIPVTPTQEFKEQMGVSVCCILSAHTAAATLAIAIATQPPMINNNDRTTPHYNNCTCVFTFMHIQTVYTCMNYQKQIINITPVSTCFSSSLLYT